MKKEQLIQEINEKVPDGAEVVIFDHAKNLHNDYGDGSAEGIYKEFDVEHFTEEEIKDGCIPFSALTFTNEDYPEGEPSSNEEELHKEIAKAAEAAVKFLLNDWKHNIKRKSVTIPDIISKIGKATVSNFKHNQILP